MPTSQIIHDPVRRAIVTGSAMAATLMMVVDSTIAQVALPHIQSSMSASQDQAIWVLTSYLIAASISTPLSAWLAGRFGRKRVMMIAVAGFTLSSLACGIAENLTFLVVARILQGLFGAGLLPLSQAMLFDINPPERHGKAMSIYAAGSMVGPLIGPTIGGWLTDSFSWRWCFLINLPFGILALAGMGIFMAETRDKAIKRFDLFGFATVSIFLASFQLVIDRGQHLGWFDSLEICIEAAILATSFYLMVVHMLTGRDTFIRPQVFKDRNFVLGCVISAAVGIVAYAAIPPIVIMMQTLFGYTAMHAGLISSPRGIGNLIAMVIVGRFVNRYDARLFLFIGLVINAFGLLLTAHLSLAADEWPLLVAAFVQGIGSGLVFVPLSITVFATLSQTYRNEGAAIYVLTRNMGAALGMSYLASGTITNSAQVQSRLSEAIRPDNPLVAWRMPGLDFVAELPTRLMQGQILRQAAMVAYIDLFWLLCLISLAMTPVVMLLRPPKTHPKRGQ